MIFFKTFFLSVLCCSFLSIAHGQVGIGTASPNASAKLQVDASNMGFLPPRVALTGTNDASTITSPATGLLVYNTATAGTKPNDVIPGYYYYNGSSWVTIGATTVETWSTKTPVSISATTTAPTKATTTIDDYVRYRKVGPKEYEVEYKYFTTNSAGAAAGSGEYLFTLPAGLSFDVTENRLYTSNRGAPSWGYQISGAYGLMVYDFNWTSVGIIPYDATRFRVAATIGGSGAGLSSFVSSSFYAITNLNISYNFYFRFFAQ